MALSKTSQVKRLVCCFGDTCTGIAGSTFVTSNLRSDLCPATMASCHSSVPARLLNARDYEAAAKDKLAPSVFAALARGRGCAPAAVDSAFNLSVIR